MSELFGKLTNLSYEFFGVLLPGVLTSLFILLAWAAMGPMAPSVSAGELSQFHLTDLADEIDSLSTERGIGALVLLVIGWYLLGHLVLWISRSCERIADPWPSALRRTFLAVTFRFPRPKASYDTQLEPLFQQVKKKFEVPGVTFEWRQF